MQVYHVKMLTPKVAIFQFVLTAISDAVLKSKTQNIYFLAISITVTISITASTCYNVCKQLKHCKIMSNWQFLKLLAKETTNKRN